MAPLPEVTITRKSTELASFLGSDGGILGVGAPELVVVVLIGYFVLGPQELYKLTKEIGKFISSFRAVGTEATKAFTDNMETQIAMDEIRQARDELNDAFSFRRSINWEEEEEAELAAKKNAEGEEGAAAKVAKVEAETDGLKGEGKKKKIRRRVKKRPKPEPEEELQQQDEAMVGMAGGEKMNFGEGMMEGFAGEVNNEGYIDPDPSRGFEGDQGEEERDGLSESYPDLGPVGEEEGEMMANDRFKQQLDVDSWNSNIMDNEESMEPLAVIMKKIALLEEEREGRIKMLEEEFRMKNDLEEKFYREKKVILEEGAKAIGAGVGAGGAGNEE
ncbi:hypothetical protein TrCOL_g2817 [Triparma columacea]|uniref:Uncharacterized protein n=1 Tax=Triparma columacea TaxID=722753 RepID=A0A9W7G9M2_9STRA|nr:hypothetical protein TrCOL_g2817 [Triparma columacea]